MQNRLAAKGFAARIASFVTAFAKSGKAAPNSAGAKRPLQAACVRLHASVEEKAFTALVVLRTQNGSASRSQTDSLLALTWTT
jgi:hypothetical protein